jgi:hypothetical protein
MRSTIAMAVRHRSNSSFCCALKASSDLAGLQIMLDGINTPLLLGGSAVGLSATDAKG